jgi:hypothetical protein
MMYKYRSWVKSLDCDRYKVFGERVNEAQPTLGYTHIKPAPPVSMIRLVYVGVPSNVVMADC